MTIDTSQALQGFYDEARELLAAMEAGLLSLESGADEAETVNAIFRAAHTIKGSAGLFGLEPVVRFAHAAETLLDQVRAHQVPLTPGLISHLLNAKDHLRELLDACERGEVPEHDLALADRLLAYGGTARPSAPRPSAPHAPEGLHRFEVHARFGPDVLKDGMDPLAFVRFLEKQGRLEGLRTDLSSLPTGEAFDPERCYLTLDFTIETKAEQKAIEDVFEFVKDTSEVRVTPVAASMAVAVAAPAVPAPLPSAPPPQRRPTPAARRAPSRSPPTSWTSWSTSSVSWSSPAPPRA